MESPDVEVKYYYSQWEQTNLFGRQLQVWRVIDTSGSGFSEKRTILNVNPIYAYTKVPQTFSRYDLEPTLLSWELIRTTRE